MYNLVNLSHQFRVRETRRTYHQREKGSFLLCSYHCTSFNNQFLVADYPCYCPACVVSVHRPDLSRLRWKYHRCKCCSNDFGIAEPHPTEGRSQRWQYRSWRWFKIFTQASKPTRVHNIWHVWRVRIDFPNSRYFYLSFDYISQSYISWFPFKNAQIETINFIFQRNHCRSHEWRRKSHLWTVNYYFLKFGGHLWNT